VETLTAGRKRERLLVQQRVVEGRAEAGAVAGRRADPPRGRLGEQAHLLRAHELVTGDLQIRELSIDPAAIDPDDAEMLQDMVLAAINEGIRAAQERAESKMGGIAGGLGGGPGGLGLPGM